MGEVAQKSEKKVLVHFAKPRRRPLLESLLKIEPPCDGKLVVVLCQSCRVAEREMLHLDDSPMLRGKKVRDLTAILDSMENEVQGAELVRCSWCELPGINIVVMRVLRKP